MRVLQGHHLGLHLCEKRKLHDLSELEFSVFSQFGDDGIIHFLTERLAVPPEERWFVEFGVEDYQETNTRFLMEVRNWEGLIMDGNPKNMESVRVQNYYWRHGLRAVHAWVDRDNINELIRRAGIPGLIGLLSIDIDGNDYWVWERLTCCTARVVIAEYNAVFGLRPVSIPYDAAFQRGKAHHSYLYRGCSLGALCHLANRKGLAFIGCNSSSGRPCRHTVPSRVRRQLTFPPKRLLAGSRVPRKPLGAQLTLRQTRGEGPCRRPRISSLAPGGSLPRRRSIQLGPERHFPSPTAG